MEDGSRTTGTMEHNFLSHALALVQEHASRRGEPERTGTFLGDLNHLRAWALEATPQLFPKLDSLDSETMSSVTFVEENLVDAVVLLGRAQAQPEYEVRYLRLQDHLDEVEERLSRHRYLLGSRDSDFSYADCLLFCFLVRLEPVFYELCKATFPLHTLPRCWAYARDLFERLELAAATDVEAIRRICFSDEPELNPGGRIPRGGIPDWHAPHRRHLEFGSATASIQARGTEESGAATGPGEWVRGRSEHRSWIQATPTAEFPAEAGRYHLFAPYNCPWSHRALLARSLKGLTEIVGASVLCFRRDPERGWQFNARIPGCTADLVGGQKYLRTYYERAGSKEKSAPLLWDTKTERIVSNESADILRMFDEAFFAQLPEETLTLRPPHLAARIDEWNELIYQRINNGAYKAGFAQDQRAYERAFDRYFSALAHLEGNLPRDSFLLGTSQPTEVDVRLFPTLFRHDNVYFARFKLDLHRLDFYPRLSTWLRRMLDIPAVAQASNLDHARNGYFGRSGNGIVPAGPTPLGLSPSQYPDAVWLNEGYSRSQ